MSVIIRSKSIATHARKYILRTLAGYWIVEIVYDRGTCQYTTMILTLLVCMVDRQSLMLSTSHPTVTQRHGEEAVVPVVSSLPKWARGVSSNRSESAGRCTNSVMKPSRSIVLLQYRNASSQEVENKILSSDEDDSIFCPEPFINLGGQISHLIVGTAKAVLHVSTNTYTVDSVLEFDHSDVLNHIVSKTKSEGVVKSLRCKPTSGQSNANSNFRHPPRDLPAFNYQPRACSSVLTKSMKAKWRRPCSCL